jgi:hypothetical protein
MGQITSPSQLPTRLMAIEKVSKSEMTCFVEELGRGAVPSGV